jgi:hypothetical protein
LKELIEAVIAMPNPTQFTGLLSFGVAAMASAFAAVTGPGSKSSRLWAMLTGFYTLLFLEVLLSSRFALGNFGRQFFLHARLIEHKTLIQLSVIGFILVLYGVAASLNTRLFRMLSPPSKFALVSSLATSLLFVLESISLHSIDALLYRPMFGVLLIGYLWLLSGGIIAVCACKQYANDRKSSAAGVR